MEFPPFIEGAMNAEVNQTVITDMNPDKEFFETIQLVFGLYLIPIVCIPGLIGNILCIIVFVTNSMQRFLTTHFLLFLAVSDTIKLSNDLLYPVVLIIQAFNQQFGKKLFLSLYRYCHYINTVATLSTAWLTLIVAIERYILCSANSHKRLIVQRNSLRICYSIIICSLIIASPVLFRYVIVPTSSINQKIDSPDSPIRLSNFGSSHFFRIYFVIIDFIRAIIPSLLLLYLNTRVVYSLYRMKSSAGTAFYRLTISLIIIIGCFICCYFPDALLSLILRMGYIDEAYHKRAIREITDFFHTFNSAINFPVYFSISYTFRRSVLRLIEGKPKSYQPTTYGDIIQRQRRQQEQQQQQALNNIRTMV